MNPKGADGVEITVGDMVRIVAQTSMRRNVGPPIGAILPVESVSSAAVRVPWAEGANGTYGKTPRNVVKVDSDLLLDEGL